MSYEEFIKKLMPANNRHLDRVLRSYVLALNAKTYEQASDLGKDALISLLREALLVADAHQEDEKDLGAPIAEAAKTCIAGLKNTIEAALSWQTLVREAVAARSQEGQRPPT